MDSILIWMLMLLTTVQATNYAENKAVRLFQEYVQMNTTSGSDLTPAVHFWSRLAEEVGVPINVYEYEPGYPVVVMKWAGVDSSLGGIMLNSHMDVVPADLQDGWTYPPFAGHIDDNGVIWGRGTQDTKALGIQHYEALKRLKASKVTLRRNVFLSVMPDEELGSRYGMTQYLQSPEFEAKNVAFEMDEGGAADFPQIPIFYQDKVVWQVRYDCYGPGGHSSTFDSSTVSATGQCANVMKYILGFVDQEYKKSVEATVFNAGAFTTTQMNIMKAGGVANNIVPDHGYLVIDIRLGTSVVETDLHEFLTGAIANLTNTTMTYITKDAQSPATRVDSSNPFWVAVFNAATKMNVTILPVVSPGSTDARFVRDAGYPALSFSPMPNTPTLMHSVDERLAVDTFLAGIDIFEQIIKNLANIPGCLTTDDPSGYNYRTV